MQCVWLVVLNQMRPDGILNAVSRTRLLNAVCQSESDLNVL